MLKLLSTYLIIYSICKSVNKFAKLAPFSYSTGPNNSVALNKPVGGIFFSPFLGENACFGENFNSYCLKKAY